MTDSHSTTETETDKDSLTITVKVPLPGKNNGAAISSGHSDEKATVDSHGTDNVTVISTKVTGVEHSRYSIWQVPWLVTVKYKERSKYKCRICGAQKAGQWYDAGQSQYTYTTVEVTHTFTGEGPKPEGDGAAEFYKEYLRRGMPPPTGFDASKYEGQSAVTNAGGGRPPG